MHPWTWYKNVVIHTNHGSCFTHSNNRGKLVYWMKSRYNIITVDAILNCNQSLFKNYRKKFREMETHREHITQIKRNLESLSALVLILKKSLSFYIQQEATLNRSKIYVFTQNLSQLKIVGLPTIFD